MANLKAFDNVVKNEGIKYTEINTDTLGIKPNKIYILKQDEDKKFYIESLESIVETVKSLKDKKYYLEDICKYESPLNILGSLAHDLKYISKKNYVGIQLYIDEYYKLWIRAENIIPEAYPGMVKK